ncbi:hypothetical protein BH23CHL1_BH23CHL1_04470 [soil metagenome]
MQRRPRRLNSKQRNPRAARNPAYQIRSRYHLAPETTSGNRTEPFVPENRTEPWNIEPANDSEWRKPAEQPQSTSDPEETSYHPKVSDPEEVKPAEDATSTTVITLPEAEASEPEPETTVEVDTVQEISSAEPVEPEDFSTYVRKIEEAAARSRSEHRGEALAGRRPMARAGVHPATTVLPGSRASVHQRQQGNPRTARQGNGRQGGGPPATQKPFFKRRRNWFILFSLIVLIPAIIVGAYFANVAWVGWAAYKDINQPQIGDRDRYGVNPDGTPVVIAEEAQSSLPNWGEKDIVNIVLMGVDIRPGDEEPERSDTVIIVHVDPKSGEMAMMSIPRDLLVFIPGFGDEKMNAAYAIGEANEDTIAGGGPTLVAQTIEANFNIPIHYYATVDFNGFQKIVDTVGGVIVDVQAQLSDNLYPTEDLRLTRVYFPTGLQKLDGEAALRYVRTRHADNDLARSQRQQEVLLAIRERAVVRDLITRAPELIEDMGDTVRTDLDFNQLLALANLGRQTDPAQIARIDLLKEGILSEHTPEFEGDAYYLEADWPRVHELQAEYFFIPEPEPTPTAEPVAAATTIPDAETPPAPAATPEPVEPNLDTPVMVENGTATELLAGLTAQFLFDSGFTAVWAGDSEEPVPATVIYDSSGNPSTAEHLADLLGLETSAIIQREGNGDIVVVIGDDFPQTPEPASTPEP